MGENRTGPAERRTTVAEAAEVLGISAEAVRGRVRRGTLPVERERGTVYVLLDYPADDRTTGDQPRTTGDRPPSDSTALISAKDETIATLRDQLEAERQAHAEARRIIAGLVERIPPAIEAPGAPETVDSEAASEGTEPRSWWRRMMFGQRS